MSSFEQRGYEERPRERALSSARAKGSWRKRASAATTGFKTLNAPKPVPYLRLMDLLFLCLLAPMLASGVMFYSFVPLAPRTVAVAADEDSGHLFA